VTTRHNIVPGLRPLPRIAVVLLVSASLVVTLAGVRATASIVGPVLLALVLAIVVHPVRRRLESRGLPPWLVSVTTVVAVYLLLLGMVVSLVLALGQLAALVPEYAANAQDLVGDATVWLEQAGLGAEQVEAVRGALDVGSLLGFLTGFFSATVGILSGFLFLGMVALFMVFDTGSIQRALDQLRTGRPELVDALTGFAQGTRAYMAVSAGFGLIVAVIDWIALLLLGVPGAFVWAVLAFVTNFIPNIGFVIGVIPPALIGLLEGGPKLMLAVIAIYSVINLVIQSVIQPRFVGDAVGFSPTVTLLSLVFWAWAIGPLGALLAVPLSLFARALLLDADREARWVLPLLSGRPGDEPATQA
jgi:AI-2 transport protein TqsA